MRVPPRKSVLPAPLAVLVTVLGTLSALLVGTAPAARADGPGTGTPWVVSLGDSYISGEAGRWAGSSNTSAPCADALGPTAYFDNASGTAEQIPAATAASPPRPTSEAASTGLNLACSGAKTSTYTDSNGYFKPGLDFYTTAPGTRARR